MKAVKADNHFGIPLWRTSEAAVSQTVYNLNNRALFSQSQAVILGWLDEDSKSKRAAISRVQSRAHIP
jgi:hypothetical protein